MIKVIKRGTTEQEKIYIATCRECDSDLEFQRSDAKASFDRNEQVFSIKCPVCSYEIYMSKLTLRPPKNP